MLDCCSVAILVGLISLQEKVMSGAPLRFRLAITSECLMPKKYNKHLPRLCRPPHFTNQVLKTKLASPITRTTLPKRNISETSASAMYSPTSSSSATEQRPGRRAKRSGDSAEPGQKPKKVNSEIRKQQNRIASRNYRKHGSSIYKC
jgi:hypothetical protein